MADTNEEIVGSIGVTITGDYSSLAASYSSAQAQAQTAGQDLADAFNKGVSAIQDAAEVVTDALASVTPASDDAAASITTLADAIDQASAPAGDLSDSAEQMASAVAQAGSDAEQAAGSIDDLGTATEAASETVGEAGGKLAEMAESLTEVGEALVITEGLREFGAEALSASDAVTTASIALTTLTGDAGQTRETLEGLEQLGMADGLSMPSLLTAATRMTAMLPPGTDVVAMLGMVANGAAVMGTDIASATQRFDQMVTSGTASARTMQQLGLSLASLSDALNVVAGGSVSTESNVAAMFKAMDDQGRIAVLTQALSKMGGTAQQVADQTFGAQWQQLANAWEAVMVQVGQALLPVISDLTNFIKLDVAPVIETVATAWNTLPGPVKEFGAGLALVAIAIGPVASGLTALSGLLGGLGIAASTTAAAETGLAAGETAVVTASGAAGIAASALTLTYIGLAVAALQIFNAESQLVSAWKAAASQQNELNDGNQRLIQRLQDMGIETSGLVTAFNAATAAGESYGQASDELNTKARALIAAYYDQHAAAQQQQQDNILIAGAIKTTVTSAQEQTQAYQQALGVYNAMTAAAQSGTPIYQGQVVTNQDLAVALQKVASSAAAIPGAVLPVNVAYAEQNLVIQKAIGNYQSAQQLYESLLQAYNNGAPVLGQLNAAYAKMEQAETAAANAGAPVAGSLQAINEAANAAVNSSAILATNFGIAADQATAQADAVADDDAQVLILSQKLDLLVQEQVKTASAVQAGTAQYSQQLQIQQQVVTTSNQLIDAQNKAATAALNQGNSAAIAGGQVGVMKQELDAANLTLDQQTQKANAGTVSITAWASAQKAATTAAVNLAVAAAEAGSGMQGSVSPADLAGVAYAGAAAKLQALTQAYKDNKVTASDVASATTAAMNAQIAADQAQAVAASGYATSTTQLGLLNIAVIEAQVKVNDLTTAQQQGQQVGDQLLAAQKALTTAQNELNTATGSGISLVDQLGIDDGNLVPAVNGATNAIGSQTTALQANAAALQSVAAAVQQVESDFASAIGNATPGVQGFSAPSGYYAQITYLPGVMGGGSETVTFWPDPDTVAAQNKALAQQYYDAGYTPQYIAGQMAASIADVCGWLGIPVSAAGITEAMYKNAQSGGGGGGTQAGGGTGSQAGGVVPSTETAPVLVTAGTTASGTATTTGGGTTSSTTVPVTTTSTAGTAAIDGGSYPAVTAHQAAGEVWAVDTSGAAGIATTASTTAALTQLVSTTTNVTQTTAGDTTAAALNSVAASTAALGPILNAQQQADAALETLITSLAHTVTTGTTAAGGPVANQSTLPETTSSAGPTGGGGTTVAGGLINTTSVVAGTTPTAGEASNEIGGNAMAPASQAYLDWLTSGFPPGSVYGATPLPAGVAPPTSYPTAPTAIGSTSSTSGSTVNAAVTINVNGASNPTQLANQVASTLVAQLRAAGARF